MDMTQFAWRDGVLLVAVGFGVYLAVMLLRLAQVSQRKRRTLTLHGAGPEIAANDILTEPAASAPLAASLAAPVAAPLAAEPPRFRFPFMAVSNDTAQEPPIAEDSPPSFAETLHASRLEQEVRELHTEVATLRQQLDEMQALRRVSPQYTDAMALAQRGLDAQGIADHCGIPRGEAELVMALARGSYGEADEGTDAEDDYVGFGTGRRGIAAGR